MSKDEVRYLHMRKIITNLDELKDSIVDTKGGKTICYQEDEEGNIWYAQARCSDRDNFCRRTGRLISYGRFMKNDRQMITKETRMKWKQEGMRISPVDCLYITEGI